MPLRRLLRSLVTFVVGLVFGACCLSERKRPQARQEPAPSAHPPPDADAAPL